jgi:type IV pilus assembly protein PilB
MVRIGKGNRPPQHAGPAADGALAIADPPRQRQGPEGAPQIGAILVARGALTSAQLAEALLQQKASDKDLGGLLVELGFIHEETLADALAEQFGLARVNLRDVTPSTEASVSVPEQLARERHLVPIRVTEDGWLEVAIAEPTLTLSEELAAAAGRGVTMLVAPRTQVQRTLDTVYRALTDVDKQVAAFTAVHGSRLVTGKSVDMAADEAPVVQVVNMLITQALRDRASDVHIEPQDQRVRVRYRIDGALHDVMTLPDSMGPAIASRLKITAGMNIVERRRAQDGQIAMTIDGRDLDIRVATTGTIWGEKVVLRLLDKSRPLYRLGDLGMPTDTHAAYSSLIRSPFGMVICAGPTGSGKTTTLYASMTEINTPERNITTIEDPVEYVFPSINQIQINEAADVTFAHGLRSILRQDPDVILVGEIRDAETARIAVQSALTGHLVLSSLHGTDAVSALYRFLDMGIESFLIASSVLAVVGQRLIRRTCRYCKTPYEPSSEELAFYREIGGGAKKHFWIGEGCNLCSNTGYSDRIGVYELLQMTEPLKEMLVAKRPSHEAMRLLAQSEGMRSLRQEACQLIHDDVTTISEVVRCIYTL